jgi:cell division protein FtsQ
MVCIAKRSIVPTSKSNRLFYRLDALGKLKQDQGMLIVLGRVDVVNRLERFVKAYEHTISQLNVKVKYADLRYPNGFAVRKPEHMKQKAVKPSA